MLQVSSALSSFKQRFASEENTSYVNKFEAAFQQTFFISKTFEKCSILFKFKADEDFNRRHTFSISRIKIFV